MRPKLIVYVGGRRVSLNIKTALPVIMFFWFPKRPTNKPSSGYQVLALLGWQILIERFTDFDLKFCGQPAKQPQRLPQLWPPHANIRTFSFSIGVLNFFKSS